MTPNGPTALWHCTIEKRDEALLMVRRATDPEGRAALMRAAQILEPLDLPGVETYVGVAEQAGSTVLRTGFVGERSLRSAPPRRPHALVALAPRLVALLDDLHAHGIAHGAIAPTSIVFDPTGRPVLCGLSDARLHREDDGAWPARRRADHRALANVLTGCVEMVQVRGWHPGDQRTRAGLRRSIARLRDGDPPAFARLRPDRQRRGPAGAGREPLDTAEVDRSGRTDDTWTVCTGDHLWHIAAHVVATRCGHAPDEAAIQEYWKRLVAANSATVQDPDVVRPGQRLVLP